MRARSEGLSAADVDRGLGDRSLLIAWLNRGTLHLVRAEDYGWLHAVTAPPLLNESVRRLGVEGISPAAGERALAAVEKLLEGGPLTGPELRARLEVDGHPVTGPAFSHLCFRAGVLGLLVRGPMIGGQHAYVLAREWLGADLSAVDREVALADLARRYLVGHAPASDRDLARWAGVPLRDARAGLAAVAGEIEEREDGLVQLRGQRLGGEAPPPRLLGAFDPVLLGWTSREEITGRHTELVTVNGLFRPFAMVDGRAVATWRLIKGKVAIEPLAPIANKDRAALDADAADVERFMSA